MKTLRQTITLIMLTSLLAACNLPARPTSTPIIDQALAGTIVAMTLESLHTKLPESTPALSNPAVKNSPVPTIITPTPTMAQTSTPTATITPTYAVPMMQFTVNSNCREGPGKDYKVAIVFQTGQKAEAVGVMGDYWIVKNPKSNDPCWIANDLASPSGSTWTLPTVTAPPAPTSNPPAAPGWSKYNYDCVFASGGSTVTMNLIWSDRAYNEAGYKVYRDGQVVASLAADSTSYIDVSFVASGQTISYYVEAYSNAGQTKSSTITASCQ